MIGQLNIALSQANTNYIHKNRSAVWQMSSALLQQIQSKLNKNYLDYLSGDRERSVSLTVDSGGPVGETWLR